VTTAENEYPNEYHRMVVTGLVDHEWAARLQRAATGQSSERVGDVLGERGFVTNPNLEEALAQIDWAAIRAVAQAFDPENPISQYLIC
jgi:hypothetical protein